MQRLIKFLHLQVVVITTQVFALSEFAKQNVRANFGENRLISLHRDQYSDIVHDILNLHNFDHVGHHDGNMHLKLTPEAVKMLADEGISFADKTEEYLTIMERNLNSENFVCSEDPEKCAAKSADDFYDSYQTLESLYLRYDSLANANPGLSKFETLGLTFEGREQKLFWIGNQSLPLIYYFCAIHAREWITPMFCIHLAETLLDSSNKISQRLLSKFSFVITPVANVDGYVYTHTTDNTWRKTRKPNEGSRCVGTDPNRNYAVGWGGPGASANPCSDTYRGTTPFDQNCTTNIKNFVDANQERIIHVNDVHSYGQYWMSPYAGNTELPPDADWTRMETCNKAVYEAILKESGSVFKIGTFGTTLYEGSGASIDYFYGENGIVHSYCVEARGGGETGLAGFQPSPTNIKPSNAELWAGVVAAFDCIAELELPPEDTREGEVGGSGNLSGLEIGLLVVALLVVVLGTAVLSLRYSRFSKRTHRTEEEGVEAKADVEL